MMTESLTMIGAVVPLFAIIGIATLSGKSLNGGWRKVIKAPLVAVALAVALNLVGARWRVTGTARAFAHMVLTGVHLLGQCAVPMALLLIGAIIADHLAEARGARSAQVVFSAVLVRLGIMPVLFVLLARYLPCSVELKRVIVVEGAMPSAILPIILARHYGGETQTALQVVLGTTLAGFVMIPLWILFGSYIVRL